ncbi:MAG: ammonium transporter, partial [Melioribacteraceae bacterium]|nr:ammonium transporter [Melioribacteraceae bacterium]
LVLVTTSLAASAGAVGAMFTAWKLLKSPDITMVLNGILAGLVGITAGADLMGPTSSIIIGFISGILVVLSVLFFDKIKLDDPVGALSVHLVCGIFGTLAVGILGANAGLDQLWAQFIGVVSVGAFVVIFTGILWFILDKTMGLRVSEEEEIGGLDLGEHSMEAYPDFEKVI